MRYPNVCALPPVIDPLAALSFNWVSAFSIPRDDVVATCLRLSVKIFKLKLFSSNSSRVYE